MMDFNPRFHVVCVNIKYYFDQAFHDFLQISSEAKRQNFCGLFTYKCESYTCIIVTRTGIFDDIRRDI